ncbi:MAG: hypothetical protein IJ862_06665 [Selenomonadaceae bacterium]|nr:hypothetical protein [Selenomonadaceae bacterium]
MALNTEALETIIETVKKFFQDLIKPDMTIDKIAEVASPNLDKIIKENEAKGLNYSAGKFRIEYVNDNQFTLEFEMYFKDEAGKWYKAANKSEPRSSELIEPGSWKTLKALKVVEFPIGAPAEEEEKIAKMADKEIAAEKEEKVAAANSKKDNDITLEKLMGTEK